MKRFIYRMCMKKGRKILHRWCWKKRNRLEKECDPAPPGTLTKKNKLIRNGHPLSSNFFTEMHPFQPIVQVLGPVADYPKSIMCLRISCCDAKVIFDRIGFRLKFADRVKADGLDKSEKYPKIRILDYRILYATDSVRKINTKYMIISEYHIMNENMPRNLNAKPFNGRHIPFFEKLRKLVDLHVHDQKSAANDPRDYTLGVIQKIRKLEWKTSKDKLVRTRDIEIITKEDSGPFIMRLYGEKAKSFKADEGEVLEIIGETIRFKAEDEYSETITYLLMKPGAKYYMNPPGTETVFSVKIYHLGWSGDFEMDVRYRPTKKICV